jgi:hypothetical protein
MKTLLLISAAIAIPLLIASDTTKTEENNLIRPINTTPIQEPAKELLIAAAQIPTKPARESEPPKISDEKVPAGMASLAIMATSHKVEGLELLPSESTIPSTKRFIIISAKAAGKVKWFVTNVSQQQPVEWLEIPNTKSVMVFPTYDSDDKISVYAYTVVGNEPSELAKANIVVVRRTAPIPIPTPDPPHPGPKPPLPAGAKLHLTIITDSNLQKANPALAGIIDSKTLVEKITARGHKKWILDQNIDQEIIKNKGFDEFIRKIGKVPIYIIQDNNGTERDHGALPTSVDGIIAALDKISSYK